MEFNTSKDSSQRKKRNKDEIRKQPKNTRIEGYGIAVKVINGNIDTALKILKRVVKDAGIVEELRDRQAYKKPSVKKRELKKKAIRRNDLQKLLENNDL